MLDPPPFDAALTLLEQRVTALQQDRDYWRRQHDMVLADWKDDLARLGSEGTSSNANEPGS